MLNNKNVFLLIIGIVCMYPLAAAENGKVLLEKYGIQENYIVREGLSSILIKPVNTIGETRAFYSSMESDRKVKFRISVDNDKIYFAFINETDEGYPPNTGGNYIIRRNKNTGEFDNILIVLREETILAEKPTSYISITPQGKNSSMDIYLLGRIFYRNILIPHAIETLVTMPLGFIIDISGDTVDWNTIFFHMQRDEDKRIENIIDKIKALKPNMKVAEDGAQNRDGVFVYINDEFIQTGNGGYNCSGFAKWIIDGFYKTLTGHLTGIKELKQRHPQKRGTRWSKMFEEKKDTYFGLDWTRNLAVTLEVARTGDKDLDYESMDVRRISRFSYVEDKGFPVVDTRMLLFLLALKNPGVFYLGTINGYYPANPQYAQYYHVAAFFPYFDTFGNFRIMVYDQHPNTSIETIIDMYKDEYIHFVSVGTDSPFQPEKR